MNNNENNIDENSIEQKESKFKKVIKSIKGIPKIVKWIMFLVFIGVVFYLGIMFSEVYTSQTKTTKLGFEDVGELVTQTAYLTVDKDNKENRDFFKLFKIPFTESRQIFSYDIEVDASVDFAKISYIQNKEKSEITIKLPHAKIYKATLKTDSFKGYLDSESLFSRIDLQEQNEALKTMEEQAIKDAEANGILKLADENAKKLIEGLIKSNSAYKEYKIIFEYIGG